jgi:preprotein translocase subunit Sec61beta
MTYAELSNAFDVCSNRHAEVKLGTLSFFDEYEKSLFLTKAANDIVKEMLPFYDRNEKIKKQLLDITDSATVSAIYALPDGLRLSPDSIVYELPAVALYVVAEQLRSASNAVLRLIKPLRDDEAYFTLDNPFRTPDRGYAFRNGISYLDKKYSEIISDLRVSDAPKYFLKYVGEVPAFIVTDDLCDATINGVSTNANLDAEAPLSMLHEKILDRAILIGYYSKSDEIQGKANSLSLSTNS